MMKFKSKDTDVFFFADAHYSHKNICKATTDWGKKVECRDFVSLAKMNDYIVNQINKCVGVDDVLFFLGDWSFGGIDKIWEFRSRIVCQNIHFILGNHDHHIADNKEVKGENKCFHDLFSSVSHYMEISIDGQQINMSHFPMISWNRSYKGAWMLHGHCHGTLFNSSANQWAGDDYWYKTSKILDVGIDNVFKMTGEYKPLSFQEIRKFMNNREVIFNDHHDARTQG